MNALPTPTPAEQLPTGNARFIAYTSPTSVPSPKGDGSTLTIRPQVYVTYYRDIKVSDLKEGGLNGNRPENLYVQFDPTSVGLRNAFGASMDADDPVAEHIKAKFQAGEPISVGIETKRRAKSAKTREKISPLLPIHALRGATSPDGAGDDNMQSASKENTHKALSLVDGMATKGLASNPAEWGLLTNNDSGLLAPTGWRPFSNKNDWKLAGALVPATDDGSVPQATAAQPNVAATPAPQGGSEPAQIDYAALSKMINNAVGEAFKAHTEKEANAHAAETGSPTRKAPTGNTEPKQWVVWVNHEQLNHGSWVMAGSAYSLRWAHGYVTDHELGTTDDQSNELAYTLAEESQNIADTAQANAYRGAVRAGRADASYKEAVKWVRFHIENTGTYTPAQDDFDIQAWRQTITEAATGSIQQAEALTLSHFNNDSTQETPAQQAPDDQQTKLMQGFCTALMRHWNTPETIAKLAQQAGERNLSNATIWTDYDNGKVALEQFDGAAEGTVAKVTFARYQALVSNDTTDNQADTEQTTTPDPEPTPEPQPETSTEDTTPANTGTTPAPEAQKIARQLSDAANADDLKAIYTQAKEANLLTNEIAVINGRGTFGLTPVPPATQGARLMSIAATIDAMAENTPTKTTDKTPETGQDEPNNQAQPLADELMSATTTDQVHDIHTRAEQANLLDAEVTAKGRQGKLGPLIRSVEKRIARTQ